MKRLKGLLLILLSLSLITACDDADDRPHDDHMEGEHMNGGHMDSAHMDHDQMNDSGYHMHDGERMKNSDMHDAQAETGE